MLDYSDENPSDWKPPVLVKPSLLRLFSFDIIRFSLASICVSAEKNCRIGCWVLKASGIWKNKVASVRLKIEFGSILLPLSDGLGLSPCQQLSTRPLIATCQLFFFLDDFKLGC